MEMDWQGRVRRSRKRILEDVPQRRYKGLDLESLALHYGTWQRMEFSTCLWDWKVGKGQGQGFLQPPPAAGDGVCGPLQSRRQVMDDCGSFKDSPVRGVTEVQSQSEASSERPEPHVTTIQVRETLCIKQNLAFKILLISGKLSAQFEYQSG